MIYREFQDKQLSLLGFGTMRLPTNSDGSIDEDQVREMTRYAISHGVNYFDTAYPYHGGESERVIGRILQEYPRDSYYLATKYPGHQILSGGYDPVEIFEEQLHKRNFILVPGCDMPYDVPVENGIGVAQAAIETDAVREMVKNYQAEAVDTSGVELPDYAHLTKPLIEVFTLDSAQCAACSYMMGAAYQAVETFGDAIDMVEYKFIYKENVARCIKMGVPNLPSMYINGQLKFRSIIPTKAELEAAIREAMEACGK